jgi:hypothetical protein
LFEAPARSASGGSSDEDDCCERFRFVDNFVKPDLLCDDDKIASCCVVFCLLAAARVLSADRLAGVLWLALLLFFDANCGCCD